MRGVYARNRETRPWNIPWFSALSTASTSADFLLTCVLSRFSRVRLFVTLWAVARQAPLSMGFSKQEYWSGLQFPSPGDLSNPGIEPRSLVSASRFFTTSATWETLISECSPLHGREV